MFQRDTFRQLEKITEPKLEEFSMTRRIEARQDGELGLSPELRQVLRESHYHESKLFNRPTVKISKQLLPFYNGGQTQRSKMTHKISSPKKGFAANLIEPRQNQSTFQKMRKLKE